MYYLFIPKYNIIHCTKSISLLPLTFIVYLKNGFAKSIWSTVGEGGSVKAKKNLSIFSFYTGTFFFQNWLAHPGLHFSRGKKFFSIFSFSWVCTQKHRKQKKCVYTRRIFWVFCVSEYKLRKNWKLKLKICEIYIFLNLSWE